MAGGRSFAGDSERLEGSLKTRKKERGRSGAGGKGKELRREREVGCRQRQGGQEARPRRSEKESPILSGYA
jgi:hypothetical protein